MPPQSADYPSPPPPPQNSNPFPGSPGNVRLIAISSAFLGAILFTFCVYVGIRLHRGHDIADILKLRRKSQRQLGYNSMDDPPEVRSEHKSMHDPHDLHPEPVSYLRMDKRFSVRSYHVPRRFSMLSSRGRPSTSNRPPPSPRSQHPPQKPAFQPRRPPPIFVNIKPILELPDGWLASPTTSSHVDSMTVSPIDEKGVTRPEMVYVRNPSHGSNRPKPAKRAFDALPQVVTPKRSDLKRKTISTRALSTDDSLRAAPVQARELRWSGSWSDLPPTPKLALERCPTTDLQPSQLRVERQESEAAPKKKSTDSGSRIMSLQGVTSPNIPRFLASLSRNSSQRSKRRVLTRPRPKS